MVTEPSRPCAEMTAYSESTMFNAFRRKRESKLRVLGSCPVDGSTIVADAWMTRPELDAFNRRLVLFCPVCRDAHVFGREHLMLSEDFSPGS